MFRTGRFIRDQQDDLVFHHYRQNTYNICIVRARPHQLLTGNRWLHPYKNEAGGGLMDHERTASNIFNDAARFKIPYYLLRQRGIDPMKYEPLPMSQERREFFDRLNEPDIYEPAI
jgi:hypothetical protein